VLQYLLRGFPGLFTVISEHICFLLLVFFLFLHFLVVGSVTHVGFRAHVKIASRIVSYRIVANIKLANNIHNHDLVLYRSILPA